MTNISPVYKLWQGTAMHASLIQRPRSLLPLHWFPSTSFSSSFQYTLEWINTLLLLLRKFPKFSFSKLILKDSTLLLRRQCNPFLGLSYSMLKKFYFPMSLGLAALLWVTPTYILQPIEHKRIISENILYQISGLLLITINVYVEC